MTTYLEMALVIGLRGRRVYIDATGLESFTEVTFNADTQIETGVRSDGTWKTALRNHGLVLETETAAGRTCFCGAEA